MRRKIQLDSLYEMFRDRIEENVVYIVYSENDGKIDTTIDQLMAISSCSFTGYHFEPPKPLLANNNNTFNGGARTTTTTTSSKSLADYRSAINSRVGNLGPKKTNAKKLTKNGGLNNEETTSEQTLQEQIDKLQSQINDLLLEKNSSHDKASQYLTKKMYPVTSYYSEFASQLRRMIEVKTNKLVDLLLKKSENADSIDLHGLNPIQARAVISELLRIRQNKLMIDKQGTASIDIITGWGKHTVAQGRQKIRPTIVALLREKGLEYRHLNKGAIRVTIRR